MVKKKIFSLLILVSLLVIPIGSLGGIQIAGAQDDPPPPQEVDERLDQDVADPDLVPRTPITEALDALTTMTGPDPYQGALTGSHLVEVVLPASEPPEERTATPFAPYQARPETSYFIEQRERLVPGPDVLLLEADADTPTSSAILSLLQVYGDMGEVDMFDAYTGTPTLSQLLPYDVVVTWSNYVYANPIGIGNVLANYVDAGGKVINLGASFGTHGWEMKGRFMTQGYTAMNGTSISFGTHCMGSSNPSHPIMFDITNVCEFNRVNGTTLTSGSSSIAQWDDGLIFVAAKNDRSVVTINGYVGNAYKWTGRMPDVLHNAILWLVDDDGGCNTVLHNNGPLVTYIGGGYKGANASQRQNSLGMNIYGFGHQFKLGYRMADDFTVSSPQGWQVEQLTFYAYQTDFYTYPPSSTITGVYYQIWDGPPNSPASQVIFGDLTTNRLLESSWTHAYRVPDDNMTVNLRPIMANVASAGVFLPKGRYWLDWTTDGSGTSGPWAPPITELGVTTTGDAMHYTTSWAPALDSGTSTQQGMPFLIQGCKEETAWQEINSNPVKLMDNVLAAYKGKIWSITGYGNPGVSTYDPATGIWTKISSSTPPFGTNYAHSGCQVGGKVYMYGDNYTPGFTGLWRYNIDTNTWTQLSPGNPGNSPATTGIWAPAWVLDAATKRCYLTGGDITAPLGGGDSSRVYVYDAGTNKWMPPLPNFTSPRGFHAAYLFKRPSDSHKLLCVAGGIDDTLTELKSTQCYDFKTSSWHTENSDLGALPMTIWGSGYTQNPTINGFNLWLVSGVAGGSLTNQTWMFDINSNSWTAVGPLESDRFLRTSAVTLNSTVFHIGGAAGGFVYSGLSDRYVYLNIYLPFIKK